MKPPKLKYQWSDPFVTGGRRWHIAEADNRAAIVSRPWPTAGNYSVSVTIRSRSGNRNIIDDGVVEFIHGLESLWEAQKEAERCLQEA